MNHTDKKLLKHYRSGWNDCANNKPPKKFMDSLVRTAYRNGRIDFEIGDDVRKVDYQSDHEILKQIKARFKI